MRRLMLMCALVLPLCLAKALLAQTPQPSAIQELDRLERDSLRLLEDGQFEAYYMALRGILEFTVQSPDIPRSETARLLVRLAGFYVDRKGDFVAARMALAPAIMILTQDLGPEHIETVRAHVERIYLKRIEIESEESWRLAGRTPQFWDGTEAGKAPTDQDVLTMRQMAVLMRRDGSANEAAAHTMNYIDMLSRAGRHHEAIKVLNMVMQEQIMARDVGQPLDPEIAFMIINAGSDIFANHGRYESALRVFQNTMDEVLVLVHRNHWRTAMAGRGQASLEGQLYGQKYAKALWEVAKKLPFEDQQNHIATAFEVMQMASYGAASAAVSRAALRDKAADPTFARLKSQVNAMDQSSAEAAALRTVLESQFPRDLMDHMPTPLALRDVQLGVLKPDEAMIIILPSSITSKSYEMSSGVVLAVTRESAAFAEIPLSYSQLLFDIGFLHHFLDPNDGTRLAQTRAPMANVQGTAPESKARLSAPFAFDGAKRLHDAFFGAPNVANIIADKKIWTIVPLAETLSIPFPTLVVDDTGDPAQQSRSAEDLRKVRWLGHERALNVVPSVAALSSLRDRQSKVRRAEGRLTYVGFGDPAFAGDAQQALPSIDLVMRGAGVDRAMAVQALPRLPGTRREVKALSKVFESHGSLTFLDQNATERQIRDLDAKGVFENIDVLHFATHGLLGGAFDGLAEPALALTPSAGKGGTLDDGLLTASEVARLRLDADWVILSACDTAGNESFNGDGLGGLAQGFLRAGARNLLVSHWRVDDQAAERLVIDTVIASRAVGSSKAEALRVAMKRLAQDTSRDGSALPNAHPSMWAPFLLIGGG